MTRPVTTYLMLLALIAVMLAIAAWAAQRTHNVVDFALGGRRLGAWTAALGYTGGMTNAWILTLMCAAAFSWGMSALWLWLAVLSGCFVNLWFVAPRLRAASLGQGHATLIQILSADAGGRLQPAVARSAVFILTVTLLLLAGAALRFGADVLQVELAFTGGGVIVLALILIVISLFSGGLLAASLCDAAQTTLLLGSAVLLLLPAWIAGGSWGELWAGLGALTPESLDIFGGRRGVVAVAFVAGTFGLGLVMPGQAHALSRCMAVRDEAALGRIRWISLGWSAVLLAAVLLCGWCASVMYAGLEDPRQAMVALAMRMLPLWAASVFVLALAGAIMLSTASLLLTVSTSFALDLDSSGTPSSLARCRVALIVAAALLCSLVAYLPGTSLDRGFFAFTALGASFGPLLLVRLSGKRIRPGSTLGAMWSGFVLSVLFHLLPDAPGDFLERVLPFIAALGIALSGGERRRNPDRADRSEETIHHRLPI